MDNKNGSPASCTLPRLYMPLGDMLRRFNYNRHGWGIAMFSFWKDKQEIRKHQPNAIIKGRYLTQWVFLQTFHFLSCQLSNYIDMVTIRHADIRKGSTKKILQNSIPAVITMQNLTGNMTKELHSIMWNIWLAKKSTYDQRYGQPTTM